MSKLVCRPSDEGEQDSFPHRRIDGCGFVSFDVQGGFTGGEDFFEDVKGRRVGETSFSDVAEPAFCGRNTLDEGKTPARDSDTCPTRKVYSCTSRDLTEDGSSRPPSEGCRAPSEAGCSTCCHRYLALFGVIHGCERMVDDGSGRYTRDPSSDDDRRTNECPTECVACAECSLADAERIAARPAGCMCNDESPKEAPSKQCRSFCDDTVGERSACHESAG